MIMSETLERRINNWLVPILMSALLTVGGIHWAKLSALSERQAELSVILLSGKEQRLKNELENAAEHKVILDKLDGLVSRREFEARLLSVEARIAECNVAIRALEVRLSALEYATKRNNP
jgi:hypothetical protein